MAISWKDTVTCLKGRFDLRPFRVIKQSLCDGKAPVCLRRCIAALAEICGGIQCHRMLARERKKRLMRRYPLPRRTRNSIPRILFYHISGMGYGGTEKSLQILAKHLDPDRYKVYFMYSTRNPYAGLYDTCECLDHRVGYFDRSPARLIPFDYEDADERYPSFIRNMEPRVFEVIEDLDIDLFVTASDGRSHFPLNSIKNIPILLINVFGGLNFQSNIVCNICTARCIVDKLKPFMPEHRIKMMYNPIEEPPEKSLEDGRALRRRLGFTEDDIVFGRIGRPDNRIFDPIGIRAFQAIVKGRPWAHYLIKAPPPLLREIVGREKIENIHFLEPSGEDEDIWAFHNAIDVMAHFRSDGEICSYAIGESMTCGRPVISHRSRIANGHLEILDDSFSRVAAADDRDRYAGYMAFFADDRRKERIRAMGAHARRTAEQLFAVKNNIARFEALIDDALSRKGDLLQ